jgi:hypothetical protein
MSAEADVHASVQAGRRGWQTWHREAQDFSLVDRPSKAPNTTQRTSLPVTSPLLCSAPDYSTLSRQA